VYEFVEFSTGNQMDADIYSHTICNSKELVFGIGNVQRYNKMGRVGSEVHIHFYI
jgi:hypothetical protein